MRRAIALWFLLLAGCHRGSGCPELTVLAAQSLEPVLGTAFSQPGMRASFGGSGTLLRQLEAGAPAGLFLSAGEKEAGELSKSPLAAAAPVAFARNQLVVIVPAGSPRPASLSDLTSPRYARIAIGDPGSVPAGHYAAQAMEHAGLTAALAPRLVTGDSVAQPLHWVRAGEADAGFVYATDVVGVSGVEVALAIPDADHDPIRYLAVPIRGGCEARAQGVIERLRTGDLQAALRAKGFQAP